MRIRQRSECFADSSLLVALSIWGTCFNYGVTVPMDTPRPPLTPPGTPPANALSSHDTLHIHYCDFAAERKGPFRMAVTDIGETTAKTFAE